MNYELIFKDVKEFLEKKGIKSELIDKHLKINGKNIKKVYWRFSIIFEFVQWIIIIIIIGYLFCLI